MWPQCCVKRVLMSGELQMWLVIFKPRKQAVFPSDLQKTPNTTTGSISKNNRSTFIVTTHKFHQMKQKYRFEALFLLRQKNANSKSDEENNQMSPTHHLK
ncbi:hypothetical protein CDAR_15261 [Caerostris darwini]|uniref:Uncharacterized protein n=1 Tax=Caerostris darwini TaxID=1538125 RepID=A0AAV4QGM7_9ARAC|nr:hypothetical protein CDAR_15261 [Caerostris darwini]